MGRSTAVTKTIFTAVLCFFASTSHIPGTVTVFLKLYSSNPNSIPGLCRVVFFKDLGDGLAVLKVAANTKEAQGMQIYALQHQGDK